jgi:molecular chaperone GrpE
MSEQETDLEAPASAAENQDSAASAVEVTEVSEASPAELLKLQLDELNDRYMRMLAETENYKKRVARERVEERSYAAQDAIQMVLPIADNLERALEAVPAEARAEGALAQLAKGVELTLRQFEDALRRLGVEPVVAQVGKPFDPNFHQALFHEDHAEHDEGAILAVLQKGYKMGERVLRPSMVKVSRKP